MSKIELLSPAGDFECIKAAVQNGADSIYFGASSFNARASASNFDNSGLKNAIEYCKIRNVKTNLTLNTLVKNHELNDAILIAKTAYKFGIDAIIVQDLGLAEFLIKHLPNLPIHASTQMSVHNLEGALKLQNLGFKRIVLSRELSANEIEYICKNSTVEIEAFVHGALCISYSGQCLASSMIGGRSGNRGKCAQPCRLPYTLFEETSDKVLKLDDGYLLSTRDLCSLEYLPQLIKAGVTCFKIEGRLKSPEYVATVTRIYRKYINLVLSNKNYVIDEKDKKELLQVFNRGLFSSGHLSSKPNKSLVFSKKQNNMGIPLGSITNYNSAKGYITLKLLDSISIGDSISIDSESGSYKVSELLINNKNSPTASSGNIVKLGRMKGNIKYGSNVFKIASKELSLKALNSYSNCENKKIPLLCTIDVQYNLPIKINIKTINETESFYNNIDFTIISNIIPEKSINQPITKERIIKQLSKTSNTPYEFREIYVNLDDNIYIPHISDLNELRRNCIEKLQNIIKEKYCNNKLDTSPLPIFISHNFNNLSNIKLKRPKISILLNLLNKNFDYSLLKNVNNIYIPLKYFVNKDYYNVLKLFSKNYNLYIYMPTIMRKSYITLIKNNIKDILKNFDIKGFVLSNISNFEILKDYKSKYDFIGNYTFNIFNNLTKNSLEDLGIDISTFSVELNQDDLINFENKDNCEMIVYGNTPIMNMNYCLLGKSNHCYSNCCHKCTSNNKFYIKDRLGFDFRVIPDNIDTVTTIYNSKITFINSSKINCGSIRLDILDEDISTINTLISNVLNDTKLEGKDFTNGNFNRSV